VAAMGGEDGLSMSDKAFC